MKQAYLKLLFTLFIGLSVLTPVTFDVNAAVSFEKVTKGTTVYVTKTGAKYHLGSCSYLRQSKISTTKAKAINGGYTACSRCKP